MLFDRGSQCDHDNCDCRQLKTIEQLGKTFMNILGAFDQFDPFKGRIPLRSLSGSGYIAKKARKIIQRHDRDNIHEILKFIDSMIAKDEYQVIMKQIRKSDYGSIYFTPPIFIKMHLDELGRKTLAEFSTLHVTWAQVFAYIYERGFFVGQFDLGAPHFAGIPAASSCELLYGDLLKRR